VKLQLTILPPDTVQVSGEDTNKPVGLEVIETDVSPEFQPAPVTVTDVPVDPEGGESERIGIPTLKFALIDGLGTT
jgi:hypothetical protein